MKISLVNLKGGVGKTTSAIYLATVYAQRAPAVLLDADPQGSASDWAAVAEDAGTPLPFDVRVVNQRTLTRGLDQYDFAVIDTPPGNPGVVDAAIAAADVVLIPTDASALDLQRVWPVVDAAAAAGKPAAVLLVRARKNTRNLAAAVEALEAAGVAVVDVNIPLREEIKAAYGTVPVNYHGYDTVAADLWKAHNGNG